MDKDFAGKVILITGGTSGIGLATADLFLTQGGQVALVGRSREKGTAAVDLLQQKHDGTNILYVQGDVANCAACESIIAKTVEKFDHLDVVVNAAGIYFEKLIADTTEEDFETMLGTNLKGTYFIAKYAVSELRKTGGGAIINVSSDAGDNGNLACSAYCAAKGAVNTFTKALALEVAPYQIRVNAVCPGDIFTPLLKEQLAKSQDPQQELAEMTQFYPLGRVGQAAEVAQVISFLASEKASFVTGSLWPVDGGITAY